MTTHEKNTFLAKKGWDVTSLDFMPKALEYTQAREAGGARRACRSGG